jgi:hypothetical protein
MRIKDLFSPARWKSVLVFLLRWSLKKLEGDSALVFEEQHIIEQYMFRFIKCKPCVDAGKCVNCQCAIPAKMWVRHDHCSMGKWGEFMDESNWNNFKKQFNIEFKL